MANTFRVAFAAASTLAFAGCATPGSGSPSSTPATPSNTTATASNTAAASVVQPATKIRIVDQPNGQLTECFKVPTEVVAADKTGATPPSLNVFKQFPVPSNSTIVPTTIAYTDTHFRQTTGTNITDTKTAAGIIKDGQLYVTQVTGTDARTAQDQARLAFVNLKAACTNAETVLSQQASKPAAQQGLGGTISGFISKAEGKVQDFGRSNAEKVTQKTTVNGVEISSSQVSAGGVNNVVAMLVNPSTISNAILVSDKPAAAILASPTATAHHAKRAKSTPSVSNSNLTP